MTPNTQQRLIDIERRLDPAPDPRVIVCWCHRRIDQGDPDRRLDDDDHDPSCPALLATDRDHVVVVRYVQGRR